MIESIWNGVRLYRLNTLIVGTGAAGYNAADELFNFGQTDIAIVTEHRLAGTSRNTGSDKQTYYKLTLSGGEPDSVGEMAKTLYSGQCVDGEHALCEASLSALCFFKLVGLGIPFPQNRYGEFVGYKTDHDPRRRATSVGPYTSRRMTEALEASVIRKNIQIFDHMQAVTILSDGETVYGLLCLNTKAENENDRFVLFHCKNLVWATGGPAGMYRDSVYPLGHYGATGIALEAGAIGKNLTEWQYGLASVRPRWNVSGTYMQVLPCFVSTTVDGEDEREFLNDYFDDLGTMLSRIFLKGYQWPFDVRKIEEGSSLIDILVYLEQCKGRRVFLDYRKNPGGDVIDFSGLSEESREYLEKAGACFGTPIERLNHMNASAVAFYKERGVDLETELLEIALCAQHNNGGLSIDAWWQTNLSGMFCVGEAAASHGVYRPGGSALNAGQVGSRRAATYIAARCSGDLEDEEFEKLAKEAFESAVSLAEGTLARGKDEENLKEFWEQMTADMSRFGGPIREQNSLLKQQERVKELLKQLPERAAAKKNGLGLLFRLRSTLLCQYVYLGAMLDYLNEGGKSRGSALYSDGAGKKPYDFLPDEFIYMLDDGTRGSLVQEVRYRDGVCTFNWRPVHPIPEEDDFFENVWREYRQNRNIF